jgi:hypothetical protein
VQSCRIAATKKATLSKGDGSSCFLNVPGRFWQRPGTFQKIQAVEGVRLVLFFPYFLTVTLASERFFNALFLAWLEVEGMPLDLFDDVLGLHLALKASECVLERFPFLDSNLCQ